MVPESDQNGVSSTKACSEAAKRYALGLADRVKSFHNDPLHSAAYLTYLAKYLKIPFQKPHRRQQHVSFQTPSFAQQQRPFVIQYLLEQGKAPIVKSFDDPYNFTAVAASPAQNEILFLTGRPSADWLNYIGSKYSLDHRFFHQHLGSIICGNPGHWSASPDLPSRSLQAISLHIPTIVNIGSQGRNLDIGGLEHARQTCNAQLRRANMSIQDSDPFQAGRSVIRALEVYDGSTMVMEQQVTATIVYRESFWTIFLWTDAGNEADHAHVPVPSTKEFAPVASELSFCPVFFENNFTQEMCHSSQLDAGQTQNTLSRQPLVLLNTRYGATVNWTTCAINSPLAVLQELFTFKAASALQYVNMLERVLSEVGAQCDFPSYEHTKLETIVQYNYIEASLSRFQQHCSEVLALLTDPPAKWKTGASQPDNDSALVKDFHYLIFRANTLLKQCKDGKATLMGNNSVQEAKRSAKEAELATQLTKATNRLTFIFLPISFVTSVFGMNFRQFGQGQLSIEIWAIITVPLLIICVITVEYGEWIRSKWRVTREGKQLTAE